MVAHAQQTAFFGTVIDAGTRETLPFASIYINKENSTIANQEGGFVVRADSADVARISFVGYKSRQIPCGQLSSVVELQPIEQVLKEVVVLPYPLKTFVRRTTKETLRMLQKFRRRKSTFFYRQTAFSDSTCYELVEAFLTGNSAVSLRNLQLASGRYAGIRPDSIHEYSFFGNFFTFSQIDIASKKEWPLWGDDIIPLFRNYHIFYDVDYDIIGDVPERIIALRFNPKPEIARPILQATIYVDEQTMHVRKLVGQGRNIAVLHTKQVLGTDSVVKAVKKLYRTNFNFVVNMTEERGFVEVQSVYIDELHAQGNTLQSTRSIIFNLGEQQERDKGRQLEFSANLHRVIEQQEYDPEFWRQNEIVRRTPMEQDVLDLFEDKQLFGVWK